jgi:uncharacterized protein
VLKCEHHSTSVEIVFIAMNIDIYTHFFPSKYAKAISRLAEKKHPDVPDIDLLAKMFPKLCDLSLRLGDMEKHQTAIQVLAPLPIPPELFVGTDHAAELASIANDAMAEVIAGQSKSFMGVALLPLQIREASEQELTRAVRDLGFKGAMIFTNINGNPLDDPNLLGVYAKAVQLEVPLWLHPISWNYYGWVREHLIWQIFGWPIDTTLAMARLVYGGIMERYPELKVITHHAGGTIPYLIGRVIDTYEQNEELIRLSRADGDRSPKEVSSPLKGFQQFYGDTALSGVPGAMKCAHDFFGSEKLVFGSDYPFGPLAGESFIRSNLDALNSLGLAKHEQELILVKNAAALLKSDFKSA